MSAHRTRLTSLNAGSASSVCFLFSSSETEAETADEAVAAADVINGKHLPLDPSAGRFSRSET